MKPNDPPSLLDLWRAALLVPVGVAVSTNDRGLLRQQLYRARYEAKDPTLEDIVILFPENPNELYIVRRNADG